MQTVGPDFVMRSMRGNLSPPKSYPLNPKIHSVYTIQRRHEKILWGGIKKYGGQIYKKLKRAGVSFEIKGHLRGDRLGLRLGPEFVGGKAGAFGTGPKCTSMGRPSGAFPDKREYPQCEQGGSFTLPFCFPFPDQRTLGQRPLAAIPNLFYFNRLKFFLWQELP